MRPPLLCLLILVGVTPLAADTRTWDGKHDTSTIDLSVVYFVPQDRQPLPDWRERVDYFCHRIEMFHAREFQGQSKLRVHVHPEPLISELTTDELRAGNADAIFFRTLRESDRRTRFAQGERQGFPILLVLSEINWRPLDDFYRLRPADKGEVTMEGNYNGQEHFPGAASGGARATYLADRGVGWGLVSADGWRVPYRGSDCVVYHEGVGHTVGLPHPAPGNGSVMSLGQYHGWISESWLDREQKLQLGWKPEELPPDPERERQWELFSKFRAIPEPRVPRPGQPVHLALDWPRDVRAKSMRVQFQTSVGGPWIEVPQAWESAVPAQANVGVFDRATPVSYRVDVETESGARAELWGYFQVRNEESQHPSPYLRSPDLLNATPVAESSSQLDGEPGEELELLPMVDPAQCWTQGEWSLKDSTLTSPKQYGARLELPYSPPPEYRLTVVVEPLDPPNALVLGQCSGRSRFLALVNYRPGDQALNALENVDGQNVGNPTTYSGQLLKQNRLSQVVVTVRKDGVTMLVDGRRVVHWKGSPDRLSLSDYWKTPNARALFLGAYDCRYRFHRITLETLSDGDDTRGR